MILASNMNDLFPHILPIMDSKIGQYPPQKGQKPGDEEFVLFIHI